MKNLLIIAVFLGSSFFQVQGKIYLNPATNHMFIWPISADINGTEYWGYMNTLRNIRKNMRATNWSVTDAEIIQQCVYLCKSAGTPTALRFAHDIRKNKIYYPDGTCAGTIIKIA